MSPSFEQPVTPVNADKKLAIVGVIVSLLLLAIASTVYQSLLLQQISITVLLASAIYILMRRHLKSRQIEEDGVEISDMPLLSRLNPYVSKVLDIFFWGLFIASISILSQNVYERPLSFLMLVAIMSSILAIEISTRKSTVYCLIKIITIGILIRGSAYYLFPAFNGADSFIEIGFLKYLGITGHIDSYFGSYQFTPAAYILDSSIGEIAGLSIKDTSFMIPVIGVLSLGFVFLIGREIFNAKVGLISALLVAVFDWHIFWGIQYKAMELGIALVPIVFWLLILIRKRKDIRFSIITILMLFLVLITHPFVNFALLVILAIWLISFAICRYFLNIERIEWPISFTLAMLFFVGSFAYWMYVSGFIAYFYHVLFYGGNVTTITVEQITTQLTLGRNAWILTWQKLPTLMFAFFAILGFLFTLNIKKIDQGASLRIWISATAGIFLLFSFFIFYLNAAAMIEVWRWHVFVGLILVFPVTFGLLSITGRNGWRSLVGLFLLMFLLTGTMLTSKYSNQVSVIPWDQTIRLAYMSSELTAAETISQMAGFESKQNPTTRVEGNIKIYSDDYYLHPFYWYYFLDLYGLADASSIFLGESTEINGILVLRQALITEVCGIKYAGIGHGEFKMELDQYQSFVDDPQYSLIYNCGTVVAVTPSEIGVVPYERN